jgi:hypothetical protein
LSWEDNLRKQVAAQFAQQTAGTAAAAAAHHNYSNSSGGCDTASTTTTAAAAATTAVSGSGTASNSNRNSARVPAGGLLQGFHLLNNSLLNNGSVHSRGGSGAATPHQRDRSGSVLRWLEAEDSEDECNSSTASAASGYRHFSSSSAARPASLMNPVGARQTAAAAAAAASAAATGTAGGAVVVSRAPVAAGGVGAGRPQRGAVNPRAMPVRPMPPHESEQSLSPSLQQRQQQFGGHSSQSLGSDFEVQSLLLNKLIVAGLSF